jgi:hypothetical protein
VFPVYADEWTSADTYREVVYLAVDSVDWAQTRNIARSNGLYYEQNNAIGRHPSVRQVDRYFAEAALAHVGIAYTLPKNWRAGFQYVSIGVELGWVSHNRQLNISARF